MIKVQVKNNFFPLKIRPITKMLQECTLNEQKHIHFKTGATRGCLEIQYTPFHTFTNILERGKIMYILLETYIKLKKIILLPNYRSFALFSLHVYVSAAMNGG